jgi:hypothetical protein
VRLGDGIAHALSPDGLRAIVRQSSAAHLDVIPTGAGQASRLERPALQLIGARWRPDGRQVVARARPAQGVSRLYVLDVEGGGLRAVTPETLDVGGAGWAVSPEGAMVAVPSGQGVEVFPLDGGSPRRVAGSLGSWNIVGWIDSGLLVSLDPAAGGTVLRVDPATGRQQTWADIQPRDPAGIMTLNLRTLAVTPDGRGYGYTWHRAMSDLYLVEGWS